MVKTKSAYDPPEESDGERILVSRYWPRGLSKEHLSLTEHLKDVAPSIELLKDWKASKISWANTKNVTIKKWHCDSNRYRLRNWQKKQPTTQ